MKSFKEMNNIDKAQLIHALFPDDINHMLTFFEDSASMILNSPSLMPEEWNRKIDLAVWQKEAETVQQKINEYRGKMVQDGSYFAATLFKGYLDFFPLQCLRDYTLLTPNQKLADAIELLFEP
ncbi:hypothetical protein FRZ67_19375 [Panacibacter ginsenosidivorans]|uniref:Uncharacterized protein n=1 Tax=Panacibacter ginsenosidivorans TaxID=1813871 RepID=A0A5B8VDG8_9BACT|nr:hypothetical protein [Panacibacter ginsenosidivorans]QEC69362.1 hypothetical protein FRZ67_19375 [Panacibacter ginsenosidivorans]